LTVSGTGEGGQVRLAHQRVLTDWARAREIVAGSADFYRIHADVERQRRRWEANRRADLLLPRGLPLAEAESIVQRYGEEVGPETRAFVRASRARAGRAQMITAAAAAVFAIVAAGAVFQTWVAREQTRLGGPARCRRPASIAGPSRPRDGCRAARPASRRRASGRSPGRWP